MFKGFQAFLLTLSFLLLVSCGGGGGISSILTVDGGISGTGISQGPISGFGSIYVNGVKYEVDEATLLRNGKPVSTQTEFQLGEIIKITGQINQDGLTGTANTVEFNNAFEGNITQTSQDDLSIEVLGQTIISTGTTLLHGFQQLQALQLDNIVEISAQRNANQQWIASSITLKQPVFKNGVSELSIQGRISNIDQRQQTFQIGKQVIFYGNVAQTLVSGSLVNDIYIEVTSSQALQNGQLIAKTMNIVNRSNHFPSGSELELTGYIDQFTSSSEFHVNGQAVVTLGSVKFENGQASDLKLNTLVEVEGTINQQGVLETEEVSIKHKDGSDDDSEEREGVIDSINYDNQTFSILTDAFVVDSSTTIYEEVNDSEQSLRFSSLSVNDKVEVYGRTLADGSILSLKIERKTED